jgi:hypothetical protein
MISPDTPVENREAVKTRQANPSPTRQGRPGWQTSGPPSAGPFSGLFWRPTGTPPPYPVTVCGWVPLMLAG